MTVIGLAGPARSGKNTAAEVLVQEFDFMRLSFSDALYREVAFAFRVPEALFRDDSTKDVRNALLRPSFCDDFDFISVLRQHYPQIGPTQRLSPRQVLQWWGTEYRRAQAPNYWVDRLRANIEEYATVSFGALRVVVDGVRFHNEVSCIRSFPGAQLWLVDRNEAREVNRHDSEEHFRSFAYDAVVGNNGSTEELQQKVRKLCESILS